MRSCYNGCMQESWIKVVGFNNYRISNFGRIFNEKEKRELHPVPNKKRRGYFYISLQQDGRRENMLLSRLVAKHFLRNPNNLPQVNHINGNKSNNRIDNLEWITAKDNILHAITTGLAPRALRGNQLPMTKTNEKDVKHIRQLALDGYLHKDIAKKFKLGVSTVTHIVNRTRWSWVD